MSKKPSGGSRQPDLFPRSKTPRIPIEENHRLVLLTEQTDWTELEARAEEIRMSKLKSPAGRPPHLRVLLGALMLKATRDMTWREAEDQMRHYAPARYLCALTETEWTPDFTTLHDFAVLLGEEGMKFGFSPRTSPRRRRIGWWLAWQRWWRASTRSLERR